MEEKVSKAAKILLLKQFSYGVIAYVVATAVVVLLPIFVTSAPGEQAVRVVLVMQNIVLFVFLAGLAWIFRCGSRAWLLVVVSCECRAWTANAVLTLHSPVWT